MSIIILMIEDKKDMEGADLMTEVVSMAVLEVRSGKTYFSRVSK